MPSLDSRQNFYSAASEIAQRIRERCPAIRNVVMGMQRLEEGEQLATPVAVLMQLGTAVTPGSAGPSKGGAIAMKQRWQVQLMVERTTDVAAYDESGFLMIDVLQALHGWRPKCASGSLYLLESPEPALDEKGGFGTFAHNFELPLIVQMSAD